MFIEGRISHEVGHWIYFFDEKRKRRIARFAPVDKMTGKQLEYTDIADFIASLEIR